MSRHVSSALTAVGVSVLLVLLVVGSTGARVPVWGALPLVGLLFAGGSVVMRRRRVADIRWSRGPNREPRAIADADVVPVRRPAATGRQLAAALGRVEARELVSSPWFGVGVGFCVVLFLMFGVFFVNDAERSWTDLFSMVPAMAHPLVGLTVLAAHRGITRSRREGTDELFDTCPLPASNRVVAHLRTAWVPVVAYAVFLTALVTTLSIRNPRLYGPIGGDAVAYVLAALVLCVGGVALGQYLRWGLVPVVAVIGVAAATGRLSKVGNHRWSNVRELATWPAGGDNHALLFSHRPLWWHVAWLVALAAVVAVIAVARLRRDRLVAITAVAVAALTSIAGFAVTRPMSASAADHIADLVARPAAHQVCVPAGSGDAIVVCAFRPDRDFAELVAGRVASMASSLPPGIGRITLRQVFDGHAEDLPAEVAARVGSTALPLSSREVRLSFSSNPGALLANRQLIAFMSIGLPTELDDHGQPLVVAGQARGVIALWLATGGLAGDDVHDLTTGITEPTGNGPPDAFDRGTAWPARCHLRDAPVVWSAQDLEAGRAVVALPRDTVKSVVHAGWAHWTDPATSTNELLAALGLPAVGPFDHFATRPNTC